jgi:hypothetical protein
MDKNIAGYCRYIGLVSFVAYRPDTDSAISVLARKPAARSITQSGTETAPDR